MSSTLPLLLCFSSQSSGSPQEIAHLGQKSTKKVRKTIIDLADRLPTGVAASDKYLCPHLDSNQGHPD